MSMQVITKNFPGITLESDSNQNVNQIGMDEFDNFTLHSPSVRDIRPGSSSYSYSQSDKEEFKIMLRTNHESDTNLKQQSPLVMLTSQVI